MTEVGSRGRAGRASAALLGLATLVILYGVVSLVLAPEEKRTSAGVVAFLTPNLAIVATLVWLARGVRSGRFIVAALAMVLCYGVGTTALAGILTMAGAYRAPVAVWVMQGCLLGATLYAALQLWRCWCDRTPADRVADP